MTVTNRIQPGDGDPRHGMATSYQNHHCRCDRCRAGQAAMMRAYRRGHRAELAPSLTPVGADEEGSS